MANLCRNKLTRAEGFTLVELLVAVAILGLALVGMYAAYTSTQRTTYDQEEVVDLQQNLRVTINMLGQDIRMAGFLTPSGVVPVQAGSTDTKLILATASTTYRLARLAVDNEIPAGASAVTPRDFTIATHEMVERFENVQTVHVIRAMDGSIPLDTDLTVSGWVANRDGNGDPTGTAIISLTGFNNPDPVQYIAGDLIVEAAGTHPMEIVWALNDANILHDSENTVVDTNLERNLMTIASDITDIRFNYRLDDGTNFTSANPNDFTPAIRERIIGIQVVMTAETKRQLDGEMKQRQMGGFFQLKNR